MATFVPISYTYVPTAPRSKSATACRKPAPKQSSILDKLQHIKPSSTSPSTARPAAAARRADGIRSGKLGTRETDTINDSDDDDYDLPSIEQLLYTTLQKEGFAAEDQRSNNTNFGVGEATAEERSGSHDDNGSAPGDNLGGSSYDPIILLGDDDSSASKAEIDNGGRTESAGADTSLFDNSENAADSTTPAPPSPDVWHDIDNFPKTSQGLRLAQQGASASNSTHAPLMRLSSEPLNDSTSAVDLDPRRARSEVTISCSAHPQNPPPRCAPPLSENQLSHEDRLHTSRGEADERGLVGPARNANPADKRERRQQQEDEDYDASSKSEHPPSLQAASVEKCRPLCENSVILDMEVIDPRQADVDFLDWEADSMAPTQRAQQLLPNRDPSPATSHDAVVCDIYSDDELNNTEPDEDDEKSRPVKRKRPFSSQNGPMHKKPKHRLQQRSTRQHRLPSKPHRRSPKSYFPQDLGSRVTVMSNTEVRLPSPAPSAPHATDTDMPSDCDNLGPSSGDILPTLTEVTFRPHSTRCCSFTAVVRDGRDGRGISFSQLAQLIKSVGHVGKIDDFTIKPIEQHSFLLTGFSRHTSSQLSSGTILSPTVEENCMFDDAPSTTLQHSKAVDAEALLPEGSDPSSSDDESGLSDSDLGFSSDDDACWSKKKQGSSTRMNVPWEPVDEQRLLAYKKEDKSWEWIFKKFPGRTAAAVRTRWTMVQHRVK